MANDRETWDVVLDDSFVDGAAHREPSAAERAAEARRAHKAARKTTRRVAGRQRRDRRRQRLGRHRRVIAVLGLFGLAVVWSRWPTPARPTVAAGVVPTSVRVVYALPADASLDDGVIPAVRHELGVVQQWFETQTGGKHLRLVTDNQVTSVDVRHLTVTAAELRDRPDAASLVDDELRPKTTGATGPAPDEILLSFVPVTFPEQVRCGEGSQAGFAIVWVGSCGVFPSVGNSTFGDGATFVMAHELVHALGAVPPCAPHYGRNGHVIDDPRDLLYDGPTRAPAASLELDPGHDDYFHTHRADCPDIGDSPAWTS